MRVDMGKKNEKSTHETGDQARDLRFSVTRHCLRILEPVL